MEEPEISNDEHEVSESESELDDDFKLVKKDEEDFELAKEQKEKEDFVMVHESVGRLNGLYISNLKNGINI